MNNGIGTSGATSRGTSKIRRVMLDVRATFVLTGIAISLLISACGGGDEFVKVKQPQATVTKSTSAEGNAFAQAPITESTSPDVRRLKALAVAAPTATPYGEATPEDAANQLLDFAEKNYSQFFPSKKTTQVFWKYTYRYYPETGTYVGVATGVSDGDNLSEGGVYVMGGPFGDAPTYVGQLNAFITPYKVARYTDKVYALWTDKYPYAVTRTGVTKVKNMTEWNGLGKDLFLCFIANHPLADGKILTLCKDLAQLKWHLLYIDPIKDELRVYLDAPPADLVYTVTSQGGIDAVTLGSSWLDTTTRGDPDHPGWWQSAKVADGYYYTPSQGIGNKIMFVDNASIVNVVAAVDPSGRGVTIHILRGYSN